MRRPEPRQAHADHGRHDEQAACRHVGRGDADAGEQDPGQGRPSDLRRLVDDLVQRGGRRHAREADQAGHHRVSHRGLDAGGEGEHGREQIEQRQRRAPGGGQQRQRCAAAGGGGLARKQQHAPVEGVGDRPGGQRSEQERAQRGQADQPHLERRTGQVIDLEGERDGRDLAAGRRHQVAAPQAPVGPGVTQRRDIEPDARAHGRGCVPAIRPVPASATPRRRRVRAIPAPARRR